MFLLIHIAIPLLVFELPRLKETYRINRFALIIGAILPDLVDKPLVILGIGDGRGIGHTLLFVFLSFLIAHLIFKGEKSISYPFLAGMLFHLILDLPYVPFFYPFIIFEIPDPGVEEPVRNWIDVFFNNPAVLMSELIGASLLIYILMTNGLKRPSDIFNYLKTNPQNIKKNNKLIK